MWSLERLKKILEQKGEIKCMFHSPLDLVLLTNLLIH